MESANWWSLTIQRLRDGVSRRATGRSAGRYNSVVNHQQLVPTVAEVLEDRILLCADLVQHTVDQSTPAFTDFDALLHEISSVKADVGDRGQLSASDEIEFHSGSRPERPAITEAKSKNAATTQNSDVVSFGDSAELRPGGSALMIGVGTVGTFPATYTVDFSKALTRRRSAQAT